MTAASKRLHLHLQPFRYPELDITGEYGDAARGYYCGTIGVEFMHISNPAQKSWIQERIEGPDKEISFTREGKRAILNKLIEAEGFENFCDLKFTGTKRFGLDGGPERTLEEVGEKFGVTRERVRQIRNIALNKLRKMIEKLEAQQK